MASTVASMPTSAIPMGPKVNLTSIPLQGYGEPMVAQTVMAGQLMQPLPFPIKLGTGAASVLAPNVSMVSASALTSSIVSNVTVAQPLALTTPSASHTAGTTSSNSGNSNNSSSSSSSALKPAAIQVKQEPKSDTESDAESKSSTKTTGTSTLPFSMATKLEDVKDENLDNSLTLPIPVQQVSKTEPQESSKQMVMKLLSDTASTVDTSSNRGPITMTLFQRVKRVGAPEKRERDETWKNYLIRWVSGITVCMKPMMKYPTLFRFYKTF